ncbi:hypothetical protein Misp01_66960 [Microtetraspora sp. NBRC 13810]|uniref:sensor histidine kinase n=1 Tax=Microtetraspora sp. NBRC 13810 TaxID=3030990 RepID=UPI0024A11EE2|nr:HAMP domain-containing sensor histidine kinase [Microtetraspora sp. NBRC 13810]GLW11568.1 hypothetical protein Misp01_66960 [Microtetraspora sp. NBRC 13810]
MKRPSTQSPSAYTSDLRRTEVRACELEDAHGCAERASARQRQFVSDASHELFTPVAAIRARLEEARLHPEETDLKDLLDRALDDVDRLQAIIGDLLLLARIDEGRPPVLRRLDLSHLIRSTVSQRVDRLPVRLRLSPRLMIDAVGDQLVCALTNLLDNAQRHAERVVTVELHRDEGYAELVVTDDGAGIAEADRERVFERFSRLDTARCRDKGGPGLGLAIVHGVAGACDGTIGLTKSETGGARFVLRLPLAEGV